MSRGVDNLDFMPTVGDGNVLGQNSDASFALKVIGIKKAIPHLLVFAENFALNEELVDQGGLAMVYMGDNCYISNIHAALYPFLNDFERDDFRIQPAIK